MVTAREGRAQEILSDAWNFVVWGVPWMVVLFSTIGGAAGFWFVFSRDRALGRGRGEVRRYLREYSIEIKWRHTHCVRYSEERSKVTMWLLLQIHPV